MAIENMQLVKYDAACRAIAEARSIDEVKSIADKAIAIQVYARQAKNKTLEIDVAEIRMRAERRLGELWNKQEKNKGTRGQLKGRDSSGGTKKELPEKIAPTLVSLGIDKKLASRAQKLAAVPEEKFEGMLGEWRRRVQEENERVTINLLREGEKAHVSHNSGENEWYTPPQFIEAAKLVMGSIDIDPASCERANKIVKASTYYSIKNNGLSKSWNGNIWLNPPYSQPLISEFSDILIKKYLKDEFNQACVLVNNATDTNWLQEMLIRCAACCFIRSRIRFIDKDGNPKGTPLQGQVILYFGPKRKEFTAEFSKFGIVMVRA